MRPVRSRVLAVSVSALAVACGDSTNPEDARRIAELTAVAAGADRLVAVGVTFWATDAVVPSSDSALIVSSTDGITWEPAGVRGAGTLFGVSYGGGRYVAVGSRFVNDVGPSSFTPVIYTSADGLSWQVVPDSSGRSWRAVVFGSGQFVAAAADPATSSSVIATSPDGTTWTNRAVADVLSPGVTFGAGTFVLWGEARAVAVSTNAIDWSVVPLESVQRISGMVYQGGRFIASGINDCCFGEVAGAAVYFDLSSPDGTSWTVRRRTAPAGLFTAYAFGAGRFVALGVRAAFTSTDGTAWHETHEFSEFHSAIAFRNGRFVVVGRTIQVSQDGEAWSPVEVPVP